MEHVRFSSNVLGKAIWILWFASYGTEAFIGMNWGRHSAQRLLPSQVVDLLLQNGIRHAKVYTSENDVLEAFAGSQIELTISLFRGSTLFNELSSARTWVRRKSKYLKHSSISQIMFGAYPFVEGQRDMSIIKKYLASLNNLQEALNEVGHENVTANLVHSLGVLKHNFSRPSAAEFTDSIKYHITLFIRTLQARKAPFLVDIFPILATNRFKLNFNFAFVDGGAPPVKDINGAVYNNVFEFIYDSFVWALNKINASDVRVVITQVGWPIDGCVGATTSNAERFYKHLLPFVGSDKGTPMRPGAPIDIFVHSLTDETNMVSLDPFARHWGVYRSNGEPKYKIDLSGRGRDVYPATMGGIKKMPRRWCVFNRNMMDVSYVRSQLAYACRKGDCSCTTIGGSCSQLSFDQNVSYAFNMLFLFMFQDERACNFGSLAMVSVNDPSTPGCIFPIGVVKGSLWN